MFLNHSFVPRSVVSFNEWLKTNHQWWYINTAEDQLTFSLWTVWKMALCLKLHRIFFFFPPRHFPPPLLCSRPVQPQEISIKLSRVPHLLSLISLLACGEVWFCWGFFSPNAISNLIEMHLCALVLWIKMAFFDEQRCVQPRLSRPSFRVCVPWRWIVQCLYELHILSCSKSSFGVVEGKAPHLPLRRCWSCCWIIDADSQKKSVDTEGYTPPPDSRNSLVSNHSSRWDECHDEYILQ